MKIRKGKLEDVELLSDLWYKLATEMEPYSELNRLSENAKEKSEQEFKKKIDDRKHQIFIAEAEESEAGYIFIEEKDERPTRDTGKQAAVLDLFVSEEHRGKGYGTAMIEKAEEWAEKRGCNFITLSAEWKNTEARKFYKKNGFQEKRVSFVKKLDR